VYQGDWSKGQPSIVALANGWVTINVGGGPTDDKPTVTLATPDDPDRVNSFLDIRVADIDFTYRQWSARGAEFLTPPMDSGIELRCYMRDPDGHLIEVAQTTAFPPDEGAPPRDERGPQQIRSSDKPMEE
jgi:catechol 2,3-dioxygenase-like lactoylglutathione lyase family enzyme